MNIEVVIENINNMNTLLLKVRFDWSDQLYYL
jgi:hypothetical protein